MSGLDCLSFLTSHFLPASRPEFFLGYLGMGPGQEFLPYFLAMLAWAGAAFFAVFQWPIRALVRFLKRCLGLTKTEMTNEVSMAKVVETTDDGSAGQP